MTTDSRSAGGEEAPRGDRLRELVARRANAISEQALRAGEVSPEDVEALGRLARLAEICDAVRPPARRKRWPIAALLAVTLLAVSVLLFVRMPETQIELDVTLDEVGFVLSGRQELADAMQLSELGVSGLRAIRFPPVPGATMMTPRGEADGVGARLSAASAGARRGSIALAKLTLGPETRVRLSSTHVPEQFRLSLTGLGQPLRVDVNGPVRIVGAGFPEAVRDFVTPKPIALLPASDQVDLDLTFTGKESRTLSTQLEVHNLSLFSVRGAMDREGGGARRISTVLSGTLYFESLDGAQRPLRAGEGLRFERSEGEIRTLRLDAGHVALNFRGRVRGMTTGSGEDHRPSLMPTVLEWLRARRALVLLWGSTLYVLGVILAMLRWWRKPE